MRCVGTSTGATTAAVMSSGEVYVDKDDRIEVQFFNQRGEIKRRIAMDDPAEMLHLAHELTAAVLMINERRQSKS